MGAAQLAILPATRVAPSTSISVQRHETPTIKSYSPDPGAELSPSFHKAPTMPGIGDLCIEAVDTPYCHPDYSNDSSSDIVERGRVPQSEQSYRVLFPQKSLRRNNGALTDGEAITVGGRSKAATSLSALTNGRDASRLHCKSSFDFSN